MQGLQYELSGNPVPSAATYGNNLKGKPLGWRHPVIVWENLLDLSHNIYLRCYHLPVFYNLFLYFLYMR